MKTKTLPPKSEQGLRYNDGKPMFECLEPEASREEALVLTDGAREYGKFNWMKGLPFTETLGSLFRHANAIARGEDRDPKSGRLHSAHIMANARFLTYFMLNYEKYAQFDDRPGCTQSDALNEILDNFEKSHRDNETTRNEKVPF